MPTITINGRRSEFRAGQTILQVANAGVASGEGGVAIPQYCYHDGLSIVASCRICLGEIWAPNPRNGNKLEPAMGGKLMPTCQTPAADGMVVYTDSPKAVQNQKAVMEYLLINHPLDCPVCDQAGECLLQDYSYQYGRAVSRFEEDKVKQPKKDLGPHVYLYADRCIMCTRCVRFTREVTGTGELLVGGRGNKEEIDVFPGVPLDNELSANVVDLCPVGALLDKDFLFAQRVWFLKETPSIDGITASGDNIEVHHNEGKVHRVKPRANPAVNGWWITDEVRYGWKHVHGEERLRSALRRQFGTLVESDWTRAYDAALDGLRGAGAGETGGRLALVVSPMLSCEEAFLLASAARAIDPRAVLSVGPVPVRGEDKVFPGGLGGKNEFRVYAEKAPNARGVRRVLEAIAEGGKVLAYEELVRELREGRRAGSPPPAGSPRPGIGGVILTGNYPSAWGTEELIGALSGAGSGAAGSARFVVLIDTLASELVSVADVVLPGATWLEKAGTFENARGMLQAFEQAIQPIEGAKAEGQIAIELIREAARVGVPWAAGLGGLRTSVAMSVAPEYQASYGTGRGTGSVAGIVGEPGSGGESDGTQGGPVSNDMAQVLRSVYNAADVRGWMGKASPALAMFTTDVKVPPAGVKQGTDMEVVEL